jgi:hypothetical protein
MITEKHICIHERALKCLREINAETLLLKYNVEVNKKTPHRQLQKVIAIKRERIKSMIYRYELICTQLLPAEIIENPIFERYEQKEN